MLADLSASSIVLFHISSIQFQNIYLLDLAVLFISLDQVATFGIINFYDLDSGSETSWKSKIKI